MRIGEALLEVAFALAIPFVLFLGWLINNG